MGQTWERIELGLSKQLRAINHKLSWVASINTHTNCDISGGLDTCTLILNVTVHHCPL